MNAGERPCPRDARSKARCIVSLTPGTRRAVSGAAGGQVGYREFGPPIVTLSPEKIGRGAYQVRRRLPPAEALGRWLRSIACIEPPKRKPVRFPMSAIGTWNHLNSSSSSVCAWMAFVDEVALSADEASKRRLAVAAVAKNDDLPELDRDLDFEAFVFPPVVRVVRRENGAGVQRDLEVLRVGLVEDRIFKLSNLPFSFD
jgi:hypothetical protein